MEDAIEIKVGGQSGLLDIGSGEGQVWPGTGYFCLTPFPPLGVGAYLWSFPRARLDSLDS